MEVSKETRFLLTLLVVGILSAFVHNMAFYFLNIEEGMFFLIVFVVLIAFVITFVKSLYFYHTKGTPDDLWLLGYIGFLGLLGLVPQIDNQGLFGFFGFFGLFSLRGKTSNL